MPVALGFASPWLLPLVALGLLVAMTLAVRALRQRKTALRRYQGAARQSLLSGRPMAARTRELLYLGALVALGVAAARPQVGSHPALLTRSGTDLVVAFDVSLSMAAQDTPPSRLEQARRELEALLDRLQGDRVGLVTFAGSAAVRFPLTTDIVAARMVVQDVGLKDGGLQTLAPGNGVAAGLQQAGTVFAADQTRSRTVLLISDGEDVDDDTLTAARTLAQSGIVVSALTVGHDTPVTLYETDPRTGQQTARIDATTNGPLTSAANPRAMQQLATSGDGSAYDGNDAAAPAQIADAIARLQKTPLASGTGDVPIERFQLLAAIALALLLLGWLLPLRLRRPSLPRWWRIRPRAAAERRTGDL
jgi:Ca-activated chloride channel family protein